MALWAALFAGVAGNADAISYLVSFFVGISGGPGSLTVSRFLCGRCGDRQFATAAGVAILAGPAAAIAGAALLPMERTGLE